MHVKAIRPSLVPQDRRNLPRLRETGASATIEGRRYPLEDWNPNGFMVAPYEGHLKVDATLDVTLVLPFAGKTFRLVTKAKIVRRDERRKQLAAQFTAVDPETSRLLSRLASAKLRICDP